MVHTFPKGICPKVNIIARLEYELAYYDSAVHRFNHYTTKTPQIDWYRSQGYEVKCKQLCPVFELSLMIPFPTMMTVIPPSTLTYGFKYSHLILLPCLRVLEYTDPISGRRVRSPPKKKKKKMCLRYNTKLHQMVMPQCWRFRKCCVPIDCHYSQVNSDLER